eukprot:372742-Rhodomonas_salina.1
MDCPQMKDTGSLMHDQITLSLIASLAAALRGSCKPGHNVQVVTTHVACSIDSLWQDCPLDIAAFIQDGIIIVDSPP